MELYDIDLADLEFRGRPVSEGAAAFATLRARPDSAFFAEPEPPPGRARLLSSFTNGATHLPAEWTPAGP